MNKPEESASLYTKGRTIKAHIDRANKHKDKYHQHARSAGILLIEAKAEVEHGQWLPWLDGHGIKQQTAHRLMAEYRDPALTIARREDSRKREAAVRLAANHPHVSDLPDPPKPEPTAPRQESATVLRLTHARATQMISKLTEEQVELVIEFIKTL